MESTTNDRAKAALRSVWPAIAVIVVQLVLFAVPLGVWLQGVVQGLLNALIVLGMMLVYRANRVLNLAQASIGTFPAAIGVGVILFGTPNFAGLAGLAALSAVVVVVAAATLGRFSWTNIAVGAIAAVLLVVLGIPFATHFGYLGGFTVGLVASVFTGWFVDVVIVQRFHRSPRLVLTVATIGIAQMLAVGALLLPRLWDKVAMVSPERPGFGIEGGPTISIGGTLFGVNDMIAVVVAIVCLVLVALALSKTDIGIAVRAAAERGDRASMLGIPVPSLEAGVWVVASMLSFLGVFLQGAILGVEISAGVGLRVLVAALAAMALGGFASLPTTLSAAVAIGVLSVATGPAGGHSISYTDWVLAVVVVVGLVVRRFGRKRADRAEISSWQSSVEPRRVPPELRRLPEVRAARWIGGAVLLVAAILLPSILNNSADFRVANIVALAVVALSIVILTGWAGQVTLGQMSFAAVGAALTAYATIQWNLDFSLCLLLAGVTGAIAVVIVGAPALRWQGMFFAVTTLAFALASVNYLFNPAQQRWIPRGAVYRRPLFGFIDLRDDTHMYWVCLAVLVLALVLVAGLRKSRIGRVIRGTRDNGPGAEAYGVRLLRARITAFAISGFLAGVGGALLVYVNEGYDVGTFGADQGLNIFISSVVGGVGSAVGAVLGAGVLDGARSFLSGQWALLPSATGVLIVLLVLPGGLAELAYRVRDGFLRFVAGRRQILVPSLIADRKVDEDTEREADAVPTGFIADTETAPDATQEPVISLTDSDPGTPPELVPVSHTELPAEPGWLSARGVDVAYDRVQVLFGVDVDIEKGAVTALLGTNGAGKSTLLRAIGGVAPVTGGSIHFEGTDLGKLRPEEIARKGIAQMPGGQGVFPSLTVAENLRVASWLIRQSKTVVAARIDDVRERFPVLQERWDAQAGDLSGGQQQQLALAMALIVKPKLLLIDELSLGLAPLIVQQLLEKVLALRDDGVTVVIVEQSVNVALTVADHVFFMEKGEVRFSGQADDLLAQPDLVRAVYLQGASEALASGPSVGRPPAVASKAEGAPKQEPALEVDDLLVRFGGITAVNDVSLAVEQGEIVGIIGPNGAGKTTLYDLICGFTSADAGIVRLHGVDISDRAPSGRARAGLGRSFQDARLFPGLTVSETIALALERFVDAGDPISAAFRLPASRSMEKAIAERVEELIDLFGLHYFRAKRVGDLSTGSRRMVDLACVVAHAPDVVLLDEPSSGIAQREAEALGPVIHRLRDHLGASLLVIEHDIALISSVSDRLVALDAGAVVTTGPPAAVLEDPQVVASYLGSNPDVVRRSDHAEPVGGS